MIKKIFFHHVKTENVKVVENINIESGKIIIIDECSLLYNQYNYINEKLELDKIKSGGATNEDMGKDIYGKEKKIGLTQQC